MAANILCSIGHEGKVYLFCAREQMMVWKTESSVTKFFKRLYDVIFRAGDKGLKQFHLLADFRLHKVSDESLADDSFEKAVMKPEVDRDRIYSPEEYTILNITMHGVSVQAIECCGKQAESWHKSGVRPKFPTFA